MAGYVIVPKEILPAGGRAVPSGLVPAMQQRHAAKPATTAPSQ